jgi:hypothetical protein
MKNYDHLTRQMEIIPTKVLHTPIAIIGVGAVGGWATLMLAKMGFCDLTVWDMDNVATENMNSQFYRFSDIGRSKVLSLYNMVDDFSKVQIKTNHAKWLCEDKVAKITVCGVDSMEARKAIFNKCKRDFNCTHFIDTRMASEYISQFVVCMQDSEAVSNYEKTLFTDGEAVQERCTAKSTIYTASLSAGFVAKAVKDILTTTSFARTIQYDVKNNKPLIWMYGEKSHTTI